MNKRKITGILQYGTRVYQTKKVKFQTGGAVGVSSWYNWREDPYEMMLLRQKSAEDIARIRNDRYGPGGSGRKAASGSAKNPYGKEIATFENIKGGLQVTNKALNEQARIIEDEYYKMATSSEDPYWAASPEGRRAYQKVIQEHGRLQDIADSEKKNYDDAYKAISVDDRGTYAISTNGNVMAIDVATGEGKKLDMGTYLQNNKKYELMTQEEFATWKDKFDTGLNTGYIDEFLKQGALGANSIQTTYIDPKEDKISYEFLDNGKIVKKNSAGAGNAQGIDYLDAEQFREGLASMLKGGSYTDPIINNSLKNPSRESSFAIDVANTIYSELMSGSEKDSKLSSSLSAEVLRSARQLDKINSLGTIEEKFAYLEQQKRYLLVQKLVDKKLGKTTKDGSSGDGESSAVKANADDIGLYADYTDMVSGKGGERFQFGVGFVDGKQALVTDIMLPATADGLTPAQLELKTRQDDDKADIKANNIYKNKQIQKVSNTTEIYLSNGDKLSTIMTRPGATSFISTKTAIAPGETMPYVMMPMDAKGNIKLKEMQALSYLKLEARKEFLKYMKTIPEGRGITTPANQLLEGNMDPKKAKDAQAFNNWIGMGLEVKKYQRWAKENPGDKLTINNLNAALAADKVIKKTNIQLSQRMGSGVSMQPMLGTWIVFSNDETDFKKIVQDRTKSGGIGAIPASGDDIDYMKDVNDIDPWNFPLASGWDNIAGLDKYYKTMVFTKAKGLGQVAAEEGQNLQGVGLLTEIDDRLRLTAGGRNEVTNPEARNAARFLIL